MKTQFFLRFKFYRAYSFCLVTIITTPLRIDLFFQEIKRFRHHIHTNTMEPVITARFAHDPLVVFALNLPLANAAVINRRNIRILRVEHHGLVRIWLGYDVRRWCHHYILLLRIHHHVLLWVDHFIVRTHLSAHDLVLGRYHSISYHVILHIVLIHDWPVMNYKYFDN